MLDRMCAPCWVATTVSPLHLLLIRPSLECHNFFSCKTSAVCWQSDSEVLISLSVWPSFTATAAAAVAAPSCKPSLVQPAGLAML